MYWHSYRYVEICGCQFRWVFSKLTHYKLLLFFRTACWVCLVLCSSVAEIEECFFVSVGSGMCPVFVSTFLLLGLCGSSSIVSTK